MQGLACNINKAQCKFYFSTIAIEKCDKTLIKFLFHKISESLGYIFKLKNINVFNLVKYTDLSFRKTERQN